MSRTLLPAGGLILGVLALLGVLTPWLAPYDPVEQPVGGQYLPPLTRMAAVQKEHGIWHLAQRVERTPEGLRLESFGRSEIVAYEAVLNLEGDGVRDARLYLMGSDKYGRDVFSRWLYGARISLTIGVLATVLALTIGIAVGAAAALGGRWADMILMRFVDGLLSLPWMILLITLTALFPMEKWSLILLLGATAWMGIARLARAEILGLAERGFIVAARGLGASPLRVFFRHLLPNAMTPLVIESTLRVGSLILAEATLSFLGVGVQPPHPSWGNMISEGQTAFHSAWWVATFPGVAIVLTVIAINLVGDGLRDLLDPRTSSDHAHP